MLVETTLYSIRCDKCGYTENESTFPGIRLAIWTHPAPTLTEAHTATVKDFCRKCTVLGLAAAAATKWNG